MSVADHKKTSPSRVACFILTVSDSRTPGTDTSGQTIEQLLLASDHDVVDRQVVKDEPAEVQRIVRDEISRRRARVIITTGGTGITSRDSTYEALTSLFEKRLDGFGELFRVLSFEDIGSAAMLSRATAGIAGGCALFLLPGSPAAVQLAMSRLIIPELGHIVRELSR